MAGDKASGIAELKNFAAALPGLLTTCKGSESDIQAIEAWASIFKNKTALIAKITKAEIFHHSAIARDVEAIKSEWAAKDYLQAGKTAAALAEVALGPVSPVLFI